MKKNLLIAIMLASSLSMANTNSLENTRGVNHNNKVISLASEDTISETTKRNAEDIDIGEIPNTVFLNHNADADTWTVYGNGKITSHLHDDGSTIMYTITTSNNDINNVIIIEKGVQLPDNSMQLFNGFNGKAIIFDKNLDTSNVTNMQEMFAFCRNIKKLDISMFNTSKVTSMDYMFRGCENLKNLDVSNFDTSQVTSMDGMFENCYKMKNLNISNFDINKVEYYTAMFGEGYYVRDYDFDNLDMSNVKIDESKEFPPIFKNTKVNNSLKASYDVMKAILKNSENYLTTNHLLSRTYKIFDTKGNVVYVRNSDNRIEHSDFTKVELIKGEVYTIAPANTLDDYKNLALEYIASLTNINNAQKQSLINQVREKNSQEEITAFKADAYALDLEMRDLVLANQELTNLRNNGLERTDDTYLTLASELQKEVNLVMPKNTGLDKDYIYVQGLIQRIHTLIDGTDIGEVPNTVFINYNKKTNIYTIYGKGKIKNKFVNTENKIIKSNTQKANENTIIKLESGIQLPDDSRGLFNEFKGKSIIFPKDIDTSNVKDMGGMFYGCENLKSIDISMFDTSNVTHMDSMFEGDVNLKSLDLPHFETSNLLYIDSMFEDCNNLETIDLTSWKIPDNTNLTAIFNNFRVNNSFKVWGKLLKQSYFRLDDPNFEKTKILTNNSISKKYQIKNTQDGTITYITKGHIEYNDVKDLKDDAIYEITPVLEGKTDNPDKKEELSKKIDLTKYNKYLKTFNSYDTTITNGFNKGLFINANVGDLFSLMNKFEPTKLITKAQAGYTFDTHGVLLTPFAEYYKEKAYNVTLGLGTSYKDLKTFVRYRLATLDKKLSNNIDLYVNYSHKFNIKDFYITPEIGGLGTYGIKTKLDDDVYLNNRVYGTVNGAVTLGYNLQNLNLYTKQQGRVSFDNTKIYQESNKNNVIKSDKFTWEYKGIYGIDNTINNKVKVGSNISLGINSDKEIKTDLGVNLSYIW